MIMSKLFLGIRFPNRTYEQIQIDGIDLSNTKILQLKNEISKKVNLQTEEIELMFRGTVLNDESQICTHNIQPNSLIHVLKKTKKFQPSISKPIYIKEDYKRLADLFGTVTGTQINVNIRISILSKIIMEYPEFRRNLGAQALIRDSVLFHSLDKPEVIEKIVQTYPIICEAAEFIVKTTKKELAKNVSVVFPTDDSPSDSPSSSEEENSANQSEQARIRRISRDQLAQALQNLGPSSFNSLHNIAQRNSLMQLQNQNDGAPSSSPSSSSSVQPQAPGTRITPSVLNNALAHALIGTITQRGASPGNNGSRQSENMDITDNEPSPPLSGDNDILPPSYRSHQYANQMRMMREMGLMNDEVNLNVLTLTNGNLENAINLVLTSNFDTDFN